MTRSSVLALLDRLGLTATFLVPLFLTHFRGGAEVCLSLVGVFFLIRSLLVRQWKWIGQPWCIAAIIWWGWQLLCTLPVREAVEGGWAGFFQAFAVVRFIIFAAALQMWTLALPKYRRWMCLSICICAAYIIMQMIIQAITGVNLFGMKRYFDGTLTGPYDKPRAAAPLSRMLLPILLMLGAVWGEKIKQWGHNRLWAWGGMLVILLGGCFIMALAGQRMPFLLMLFGLAIAGLYIRQIRPMIGILMILVPVILACVYFVSPGSFQHLVIKFHTQMSHFGSTLYAQIFVRAASMAYFHPWMGLGFDAYRHACVHPLYFRGWPVWSNQSGEGGGLIPCVQHPHNHYLEALTQAGVIGLVLFAGMIIIWLITVARGLKLPSKADLAPHHAWRIGLFAAVFIQEWPIASTSSFVNLPLGGWFFLLLGIALAEVPQNLLFYSHVKKDQNDV